MYVEFYNVTQERAYYACGNINDIAAVVSNPMTLEYLVDCGDDPDIVLHRITPSLNNLTDLDPGDSFQVRLFTMEPESHVLTKRIMIRGIYWPRWHNRTKSFSFEKVN